MTVHFIDHIVVALLVLVLPVVDFFLIRERAAKIHAGRTELRMKLYHNIIREEWIGTIAIVALWFLLGRGGAELGLVPAFDALAWAGYGLTVAICVALFFQTRSVTGNPDNHAGFRKQIGWLSFLTPHTDEELRVFSLVSVTAGICEEIVFRGFLIAYLMAQFGVPFWGAAILSSLVFGVTHVYQGPIGILRTGSVGGVMALLYGLTGSLWAPIMVHAAMDLGAGRMSHAAFSTETTEDTIPDLAA
jgi:membrane protease YdiL (CAAX protease family)